MDGSVLLNELEALVQLAKGDDDGVVECGHLTGHPREVPQHEPSDSALGH